MVSVERRYGIAFFIRKEELKHIFYKLSKSSIAELMEQWAPVLLFGAFYCFTNKRCTINSLIFLVVSSLVVPGGMFATVSTLLFGLTGLSFFYLGSTAVNIIVSYVTGGDPEPGVAPVIPGVQMGPLYIPLVEGWLSILLIFIIHEGAHAVAALRKGVPVKDVAMVVLGIIPIAAYVMPDEEKFKNLHPKDKIYILSSGPFSNILAYMLSLGLLFSLTLTLQPLMDQYIVGLKILSVPDSINIGGEERPSLIKGIIEPGSVITYINGIKITSLQTLKDVLNSDAETLTIQYIDPEGSKRTAEIENRGYLGAKGFEVVWSEEIPLYLQLFRFILSFFAVFSMLNLMIGVVNALPFSIFDGGQAIEELDKMNKIKIGKIAKHVAYILFLVNVLPWFI